MLGALISRYRGEQSLTQPAMSALLLEHGWAIGPTHISHLESDAVHHRNGNFRNEQIEAVHKATGYYRWVCYFWGGRIPLDLRLIAEERLKDDFVSVGMGPLYAAVGAYDLGPPISRDLAARTGLLRNDAEFCAKAELDGLRGGSLKVTGESERRADELVAWLHEKHGVEKSAAALKTPAVKAILDAWGPQAVYLGRDDDHA